MRSPPASESDNAYHVLGMRKMTCDHRVDEIRFPVLLLKPIGVAVHILLQGSPVDGVVTEDDGLDTRFGRSGLFLDFLDPLLQVFQGFVCFGHLFFFLDLFCFP